MYAFCLALTFVILMLVVTGIPALFTHLVAGADRRALLDLDISVNLYAGYLSALQVVVVLAHIMIALVIFRLRAREWICLFVGITLVANGAVIPLSQMTGPNLIEPLWSMLARLVTLIGLVSSVTILFIFPTGTFVPSWTRWLALAWAVLIAATLWANSCGEALLKTCRQKYACCQSARLQVRSSMPMRSGITYMKWKDAKNGATLVHQPVIPPWGGHNVRLQAPDGMQITLFEEKR